MAFDGRMNIIEFDEDERTVVFDTWKTKKITGHRIGAILGYSEFSTPFKAACEIAGLYPGDPPNKYIDAGNAIEPILREYARKRIDDIGRLSGIQSPSIEDPAPPEMCQYDHFHNEKLFGGMVDGYIQSAGRRAGVLEIKTSGDRSKWLDGDGEPTKVPMSYILQAGLYAQLSGLDRIVFVVGFLDEEDYRVPSKWVPTEENTAIIPMDRPDMEPYMREAEDWYNEYIRTGCTPPWTDADADLLKYLRAKPKQKGRR